MSLIWVNGRLTEKLDATVSLFDHGFLYGDGVWEPVRVFGGQLFHPDEHLRRLFQTAQQLGIDIPLSQAELLTAIHTTVHANHRTEGYVRIIVSRGSGTLGPDPRKLVPHVWIIAEEYQPFPQELYGHGVHAVTYSVAAHGPRTLGQPHVVAAKRHALERGCLEAILTGPAEEILGTTEGMLFLATPTSLVTCAGQSMDVAGLVVESLAREAGLTIVQEPVKLNAAILASEVFLAGTSCGVLGIVRIDEKDIGTGSEGSLTRNLREQYLARGRRIS